MPPIIWIVLVFAFIAYCAGVWAVKRSAPEKKFRQADLVKAILSLDERQLDELLRLYAEQFGRGPARYARRTYMKWKSGEVRPSRRTFNRLLVHLPKVMSFDLKCELLRKLREHYCAKDHYDLTVDTRDWKEALSPLVSSLIEKAYTAELPKNIRDQLEWLSDSDVEIARALLASSQAEASKNAVSFLGDEIYNIERVLTRSGARSKVTHTIKLPYGTITLKIKRG
jgi:hypothetical protein